MKKSFIILALFVGIVLCQAIAIYPAAAQEEGSEVAIQELENQADVPKKEENKGANLRLELTKIVYYLQTEDVQKAFEMLDELREESGSEPAFVAAEAEAYFHVGNWRKGLALVREAKMIDPQNETYRDRADGVIKENGPMAFVEHEVKYTGDVATERFTRLRAQTVYKEFHKIGLFYDFNDASISQVRRANGSLGRFDKTIGKGELFYEHMFENGHHGKMSLHFGNRIVGLGGQYNWVNMFGRTTVELDLHQPNWDFLENVAGHGTRDRLKLTRFQRLAPRLTATGHIAGTRYGNEADDHLVSTSGFGGIVTYRLKPYSTVKKIFGDGAVVSVNYTLDSETSHEVATRFDSAGAAFNPLGSSSREIDLANLSLSKDFIKELRFDGFAGFAFDRMSGTKSPSATGILAYKPTKEVEAQLKASYSMSLENTANVLNILGANLKWKF